MSDAKFIRIRVNGTLPGYPPKQTVAVEADSEGTPLSEYWRRRLKDAKIDNCCEVVPPETARREESEPPKGLDPEESEES